MGTPGQESQKALATVKVLVGRFILSQVVGVSAALAALFLEARILKTVVSALPPERMENARRIVQEGVQTNPGWVGPLLYGLIFASSISAALLCQTLVLWSSPRWREAVYNRNRVEPPRNVRQAVGIRWTICLWLFPLGLIGSILVLGWVSCR